MEKTGFIIPPKDSYALYDAILRMYHLSSEERECFKIESRKYALERFSIENVINTYLRLVERSSSLIVKYSMWSFFSHVVLISIIYQ